MVQEYKNSDLDLFQKNNIQDPKDNFVNKKKRIKFSNADKKLGFNYALQDVNNFKNIENTITNDKSKKNESVFFNQIDGINGLAGLTYFVSIFTISIFFGNLVLFLPILVIVVVYLFFNLKGKVGIQGDSGSYFFAATFFILITRFTDNLNFFHSLLFCSFLF